MTEIIQHQVRVDLQDVDVIELTVRRSPRSRHVRITVEETGEVRASIPMRYALRRLDEVVRGRAEWIREMMISSWHATRDAEVDLLNGGPVRYLGEWLPFSLFRHEGRTTKVSFSAESKGVIMNLADGHDPWEKLVAWYRQMAREVMTERTLEWARHFSLQTGRISIREQRTRWGSCSHTADLSFNWRLLLAPMWVMDGIIVHELCHIEELNHSDRFWALVDARYPRHREVEEWLADHGPALRVLKPRGDALATNEHVDESPRVSLKLF